MTLHISVTSSLDALEADARDGAARALALEYAGQIDADPDVLIDLGPKLLAVLDQLGLTPKSRAALVKGPTSGAGAPVVNPLDELRARRARVDGA